MRRWCCCCRDSLVGVSRRFEHVSPLLPEIAVLTMRCAFALQAVWLLLRWQQYRVTLLQRHHSHAAVGGSHDVYVQHMVKQARQRGLRAVVFNGRGESKSPVVAPAVVRQTGPDVHLML